MSSKINRFLHSKTWLFIKDLFSLTSFIVVLVILVLLIISLFFYKDAINDPNNLIYSNVFAGVLSGFIITFFHVFVNFETLRLNRVIKSAKFKNILPNRNDRNYYEVVLRNAEVEVDIMGKTASRFFQDFGSADDDKRLVDELLDKGVKFRILLSDKDSNKANRSKPFIDKYNENYSNFTVCYFCKNTYSEQSLFVVDDQCILGPVFSNERSQHTASLHFYNKSSPYVRQYLKYFEKIWKEENQRNN